MKCLLVQAGKPALHLIGTPAFLCNEECTPNRLELREEQHMSTFEGDQDLLVQSAALQALNAFDSPALVLFGRLVPLAGEVIDDGALYIREGKITAVQKRSAKAPDGFENAVQVE